MALTKIERRERIKMRIRKIVSGTAEHPRMTVFRSNKQIYVQFIDDLAFFEASVPDCRQHGLPVPKAVFTHYTFHIRRLRQIA